MPITRLTGACHTPAQLQAEEEIIVRLQRSPATVYDLLGRCCVEEREIRTILRELERHDDVAKCDDDGGWGKGWWRLPGPEPPVPPLAPATTQDVSSVALRHIAKWARSAGKHLGGDRSELNHALDEADRGKGRRIVITRVIAGQLLGLDITAHGHGVNRALISGRTNCDLCKEIGVALEELLPQLAVQRAKRA